MLSNLIYISQAVYPFSNEELVNLARQSQQHNTDKDITGMLLYKNQSFMQLLEGQEADILELMAKIKKDQRHTRIRVLFFESVKNRSMPYWSMGFYYMDDLDDADIKRYEQYLQPTADFSGFEEEPGNAISLLKQFATDIHVQAIQEDAMS
ncbi:MAG: BLUF domain-containing protein [Pseudomonadales bacterium]|nr:BLUF domain-containing protein [Pseudomonadales bacterium]